MLTKLDIQKQLRKLKSKDLLVDDNVYNYRQILSPIPKPKPTNTNLNIQLAEPRDSIEPYHQKLKSCPLNSKVSYSNLSTSSKLGIQVNSWKKDSWLQLYFKLNDSLIVSGSNISGEVQLETLTSEIQILDVNVRVLGVEETVGKILPISKGFFIAKGRIDNLKQILDQNFNHNRITNPIINFPFQLSLPTTLPSTFHNRWAAIRYVLFSEAKVRYLDETNHKLNEVKTVYNCREILILESVDPVSLKMGLSTQVVGEHTFFNNHIFTNLNDTDEPIKVMVQLQKKLWLAGTKLDLHMFGANCTNLKITCIHLKLFRNLILFDSHTNITVTNRIRTCINQHKFTDKSVLKGIHNQFLLSLGLDLPSNCRSITNGKRINVNYTLQIIIQTKFRSNVKLELPITICHPLSTTNQF